MAKKRTITLTGRPPVSIEEDNWPVIADACDHEYDGEYDFQSNRDSYWYLTVRQHEDGRTIVYAKYQYTSNYRNSRDYVAKSGVLLDEPGDVCDVIRTVCEEIATQEHQGDDADRWPTLQNECVADLPAVEI
jgi:hypothetical protein